MKDQIDEINALIQAEKWFDFEVVEYINGKMELHGSLDFTYGHQLEVIFEGIYFFSIAMTWSCETSGTTFKIAQDKDVPEGCFKFLIKTDMDITFHVLAKSISHKVVKVDY